MGRIAAFMLAALLGAAPALGATRAGAEPSPPPGATPPATSDWNAWRGADRLRGDDEAPFLNRLILERSAQLRRWARQPVDWRPWGAEALAAAAERDAPIFLVVPGAGCGPCDGAESVFADPAIATKLNAYFVPVILEPAARPALAEAFHRARRRLVGDALDAADGPSLLWARPDGVPFFAAGPLDRDALIEALTAMQAAWSQDRTALETAADTLRRALAAESAAGGTDAATVFPHDRAVARLRKGEMAATPATTTLYLIDRWRRDGDTATLTAAERFLGALLDGEAAPQETTLARRAEGVRALVAAWEATGKARYREAAERDLADAIATLRAPDGAFQAALDPVAGADKRVFAGWNGLMIRALAEAATSLQRPDLREAAEGAADATWARLWREKAALRRFDDPASPAATLEDYAWFGLGALALADGGGDARHRARAWRMAEEIVDRFQSPQGRLKLAAEPGALGAVYRARDGATPSAEGSALALLARLCRREAGHRLVRQTQAALEAASGAIAAAPWAHPTALMAAAALHEGETGLTRSLSQGRVKISARRENGAVRLDLTLSEGWRVNAHEVRQSFLIPLALEGASIAETTYPEAELEQPSFMDAPLAVVSGPAEISARLEPAARRAPVAVALTVQACSKDLCLAPERTLFRLGPPEE